jgi:hypothetical protein
LLSSSHVAQAFTVLGLRCCCVSMVVFHRCCFWEVALAVFEVLAFLSARTILSLFWIVSFELTF